MSNLMTAMFELLKDLADHRSAVGRTDEEQSYRNAIRILEAAEGIDKERALNWLKLFDDYTTWPNAESFAEIRKKICVLLSALPDPEKKPR